MKRIILVLSWLVVGVVLCGCSVRDDQGPSGPAATKASRAGQRSPQLPPAPPLPLPVGARPAAAQPARRASPYASQTQQPLIRLSTGVALPQTGLAGTLMSFSVDYQFLQGEPSPNALYAWIIEAERAKRHKPQMVSLRSQGTLQILVSEWRPEMGPFRTHLEDRRGRKVSNSVPLQ